MGPSVTPKVSDMIPCRQVLHYYHDFLFFEENNQQQKLICLRTKLRELDSRRCGRPYSVSNSYCYSLIKVQENETTTKTTSYSEPPDFIGDHVFCFSSCVLSLSLFKISVQRLCPCLKRWIFPQISFGRLFLAREVEGAAGVQFLKFS